MTLKTCYSKLPVNCTPVRVCHCRSAAIETKQKRAHFSSEANTKHSSYEARKGIFMGPTILEHGNEAPISLEGKLSSEGIPKNRPQQNGDARYSRSRPSTDMLWEIDSFGRKDAEVDVSEAEIKDEQKIADLLERIRAGDDDARFELGQFYFDKGEFVDARKSFEEIQEESMQAKYQLAVIYYDGLGVETDYPRAIELMKSVINSNDPKWDHLIPSAQYNLGRAYFEGFGVQQSDAQAESLWIKAARDGELGGSVRAQSTLGMFYSRPGEESYDVEKAHFWHQEATGNGSLESQAALGVLYQYGLGVRRDNKASFKCLKNAAERGNIYAIGNMSFYYYKLKLFNNAVDFAQRAICITEPEKVAEQTGCLEHYIRKGIAMSCFVFGRCLAKGLAVERNKKKALEYYSMAVEYELEVANHFQELMIQGYI